MPTASGSKRRGPQIGLTFVEDDQLHTSLRDAARRFHVRPTRVLRELIRDYLPQWVRDQRAHVDRVRRRPRR
jgi:hypothetical protein